MLASVCISGRQGQYHEAVRDGKAITFRGESDQKSSPRSFSSHGEEISETTLYYISLRHSHHLSLDIVIFDKARPIQHKICPPSLSRFSRNISGFTVASKHARGAIAAKRGLP